MRLVTRISDSHPDAAYVPFARELAAHGDHVALFTADERITYRELAGRVAAAAQRLGDTRRLVLVVGANRVDALVAYLAALSAGHVVLLAPGDNADGLRSLTDTYDPDVVVGPLAGAVEGTWRTSERRTGSAHRLHPELALLLSTSGSTGSPKLVRLSHANVQANAAAIASYLDIRSSDRAATTLPMHYCYGLSVVHSHLSRGAALILTGLSVADPCFWDLFRGHRGTSLAGVPFTFDLLERVGFDTMDLPHLRYITQAGGRLAPARVAELAAHGKRDGWELYVMYGQTEATARMAYLPPKYAADHGHTIGVPIPGGAFILRALGDDDSEDAAFGAGGTGPAVDAEPGVGELVYTGPNVMLGYAHSPADLARGRDVHELRTGDLARRTPEGLYEVIGRRGGFIKLFGLRIDPRRVEDRLAEHGVPVMCTASDELLVAAVAREDATRRIRALAAEASGLPARAVRVLPVTELPRLANGKPDYAAVRALASAAKNSAADPPAAARAGATPERDGSRVAVADLCGLYAEILDRDDVTEHSSFVGLGGDSLSYVEMSLRLETALGSLPADWHTRPIRELPTARKQTGRRRRTIETGILLRAVSIVLVVGTHASLFTVRGGAHIMLAVAGFNFARFQLTPAERRLRIRHMGTALARVAVPSVTWLALVLLVLGDGDLVDVTLTQNILRADEAHGGWHYWFIEAVVYILIVVAALLALPGVDHAERRLPFTFPLALAAVCLTARYELVGLDSPVPHLTALGVSWLFALGWAAAKTRNAPQRLLLTAVVAATVPGFFGQPQREAVVIGGLVLLIWFPTLPSLAPLNRVAGLLAGASLYIYLTHWQVFPRFGESAPAAAVLASLAVGIAYAAAVPRVTRLHHTLAWRPATAPRQPRARRTSTASPT